MSETTQYVDKTNNQVNVIFPTRNEYGIWAFDDEAVGLHQEPFVAEINDMIDLFVNGATRCTIYISKDPIPDAQVQLIHRGGDRYAYGTYELVGTDLVGWLCPALLKYFPSYVSKIYAKIIPRN
jgi:hypothetical protein